MMRELIVDNFCGGGGASTGIELGLGRSPDIGVNHDWQGFPPDYDILAGELTKTQQIALAGNSVCPQVAAALVRANWAAVRPARDWPPEARA